MLHTNTTREEYEALYFFWLGIPIDEAERKQQLHSLIKIEEDFCKGCGYCIEICPKKKGI